MQMTDQVKEIETIFMDVRSASNGDAYGDLTLRFSAMSKVSKYVNPLVKDCPDDIKVPTEINLLLTEFIDDCIPLIARLSSSDRVKLSNTLWPMIEPLPHEIALRGYLVQQWKIQEQLTIKYQAHPAFVMACNDMMALLFKLEKDSILSSTDSFHLLRKTSELVNHPEQHRDFLSEAKKYRGVADGKLSAYMMLLVGWAVKILTLGLSGQVWIDNANAKLSQIETVEIFSAMRPG